MRKMGLTEHWVLWGETIGLFETLPDRDQLPIVTELDILRNRLLKKGLNSSNQMGTGFEEEEQIINTCNNISPC